MKRLKYYCPFGGKNYPVYAVCGSLMLAMVIGAIENLRPLTALAVTLLLPLAALIACYFYEHRLTDGEMQIMAESSYPLWHPVPDELKELLRHRHASPSPTLVFGAVVGVLFTILLSLNMGGFRTFNVTPLFFTAFVLIVVFIFDYLRRSAWLNMDDSAVFALVPIDHMYDVEHRNSRTRTVSFTSYMVFYLPDGRYVLRVKKGEGDCDTLAIFKCRGFLTWLPFTNH